MVEKRFVPVAEVEAMTGSERKAVFRDSLVDDVSSLPEAKQAWLAEADTRALAVLDKMENSR